MVSYVAANLAAPTYGICTIDSSFDILFGQMPGHPIQIMGNIAISGETSLFADGNKLIYTLHEYGTITDNCTNVGPAFNPLENPYYETSATSEALRGGIEKVTLALDSVSNEQTFT